MAHKDRAHMTDAVSASLEVEAVPAQFPCPKCGAESRPHGQAPQHDESQRICSSALCRKVQPSPAENVTGKLTADGVFIRFPCAACGKETKLYRSGRAGAATERVCSNASCRNIFNS